MDNTHVFAISLPDRGDQRSRERRSVGSIATQNLRFDARLSLRLPVLNCVHAVTFLEKRAPRSLASTMQRVLFVDDDLRALREIATKFREHSLKSELLPVWRLSIATRAHAMELLQQESFDVVVSDVAPQPSILGRTQAIHPETIRIGLTSPAACDEHAALEAIPVAHQSLNKPLLFADLEAALMRALRIRTLVAAPEIRARLGELDELPKLPQTYSRLCAVLNDPLSGMSDVARVVETDVAATAKVLQLVNSAFLGLGHPVRSILEAVQVLGVDVVKTLVLGAGVFGGKCGQSVQMARACEALQLHSIQIAHIAATISAPELRRDSLTAGLLHDIGWLILLQCAEAAHRRLPIQRNFATTTEPEDGGLHAAIGAYLLGLWGLPLDIIDAVALHHDHRSTTGEVGNSHHDDEAHGGVPLTTMGGPLARNVWRAEVGLSRALKERAPTLRERAIEIAREL